MGGGARKLEGGWHVARYFCSIWSSIAAGNFGGVEGSRNFGRVESVDVRITCCAQLIQTQNRLGNSRMFSTQILIRAAYNVYKLNSSVSYFSAWSPKAVVGDFSRAEGSCSFGLTGSFRIRTTRCGRFMKGRVTSRAYVLLVNS